MTCVDITIPANCHNFKWSDNILLGKSNVNSDDFDTLIWAQRNIVSANIPSNIKNICLFCFTDCRNLRNVVFSNDSQLCLIEREAFFNTSIGMITIPPHVTEIGCRAFYDCHNLRSVVFSNNSELRSIRNNAFYNTSIETITIPPHVTEIGENDFYNCLKIRSIVFPNNSELHSIGKNAFIFCSITSITILSHVKEIGEAAFDSSKLRIINFSDDSELLSIGNRAFRATSIETITIPPHVTKIGNSAFESCSKLRKIVIPCNSELRSIGCRAFSSTNIKNIKIPSHITMINGNIFDTFFRESYDFEICGISTIFSIGRNIFEGSYSIFQIFPSPDDGSYKWFDEKILLGKTNENDDDYDILVYANPDIEQVTIPSSIKYIYHRCFDYCQELKEVEFQPDSKLISIGEYAFR